MKLTCEDLRGKANLYHQTCATRYTSRSNCESAYASSKNVYRPCQWEPVSQICEESPQRLACDCALLHKDCPKSKNRASTTAQVADDELSAGEGVTIFFSVVIILGGIAGLAWYFLRVAPTASKRMVDEPATADGDEDVDPVKANRKVRSSKKKYTKTQEMQDLGDPDMEL